MTRRYRQFSLELSGGGMGWQASAIPARLTPRAASSSARSIPRFDHRRRQIIAEFLADSAAATGGRFIKNTNDLAGGFLTLTSLLEVSYLLGFAPAEPLDGNYHHLSVRLKNGGGTRVESRAGYYAAPLSERGETV